MDRQMLMTLGVTLLFGLMSVGQIILIKVARDRGWTIRIRPFSIIACAILFVLGIYSLITGNYIIG